MTAPVGWQFSVEIHPSDWRFPAGNSWIAGWIRPPQGQVVTDVRARIHHRIILGLAGLPHPAFPATTPGHSGQPEPGFSFLLAPQPGATRLCLEACDSTGGWTEIFRTSIVAAPEAAAAKPAPSLPPALPQLATALLKRQRRAPQRMWITLADELMSAFVAEPLDAHPNAPFIGALEEPREFGRQRYGVIPVTGWLAHPRFKITRLSVVIAPLPAVTLPHGLARIDVTEFYAQGGQANSSFAGEVAIPPNLTAPVLLKIFAELDNGERHLVFAQRFIPRLYGATGEMPPLISGYNFFCAMWALYRAAGRYAVPRHGLIQAAQAVWAGYQALPAYRPKKQYFAALKKNLSRNDHRPVRQNSNSSNIASAGDHGTTPKETPCTTVIAPADDMCVPDNPLYFHLGREALTLVQDAVARAGCAQIEAILDLPGGYGRVARWLRTAYPQAKLTVSDIQKNGVAFCIEHLDATGVVAAVDGSHWVALPGPYDIIWCGSLLTHFDRDQWVTHLRRFAERLTPHGVLVFTTHGLDVLDRLQTGEKDYGLPLPEIGRLCAGAVANGFGYAGYPDTPAYGISVAQPDWILELIEQETDLRVIDFRPAAWDQHQDVVVCTRRPRDQRK